MNVYLTSGSRRVELGFTLIELLISVSIIAILIAIGIASYATINKQSRDTKRKSDIEQLRSALEMYRAENGNYPTILGGSYSDASGLSTALTPTFIPAIPNDPKSISPYIYRYLPTGLVSGKYYGYCLSVQLETQDPADTCTPDTSQNFGVKNP